MLTAGGILGNVLNVVEVIRKIHSRGSLSMWKKRLNYDMADI